MTDSGLNLLSLIDPIEFPKAVRELLIEKFISSDFNFLNQLVTFVPNIKYKQQIGTVNPDLGLFLGKARQGCGTQTAQVKNLTANDKMYAPVGYQVEIEMCYTDFFNTLGEYEMQTKTMRSDMTKSDLVNIFVNFLAINYPIELFRYIFMADTAAALTTASPAGVLSPTNVGPTGLPFFTQIDGVYKLANDIIAANPEQRTEITGDPNSQTTFALQDSVLTAANANKLIQDVYYANPLIQAQNDIIQFATNSIAQKNNRYVNTLTPGLPATVDNMISGLKLSQMNGEALIYHPIADKKLRLYEQDGTKYNNPHRILTTTKSNIHVCFPGANLVPEPFIYWDPMTKKVIIRIEDALGVNIIQDELIQVGI